MFAVAEGLGLGSFRVGVRVRVWSCLVSSVGYLPAY